MDTVKNYVDSVVPPQQREQYTQKTIDFAKRSPLAFSFLSTQTTFSSLPLAIFASFAISCLLITFATALVTSAVLIGGALFFLTPVLFVTVSAASLVWGSVVSFYIAITWIYNRLYLGSDTQSKIHHYRDSTSQFKREIDQNAANEYGGYVDGVKTKGGQVQDRAQHHYNAIRDTAADKTGNLSHTINGAKDSLWKDDGIVDGVKAKKDRLGNTVKDSPTAKDVHAS